MTSARKPGTESPAVTSLSGGRAGTKLNSSGNFSRSPFSKLLQRFLNKGTPFLTIASQPAADAAISETHLRVGLPRAVVLALSLISALPLCAASATAVELKFPKDRAFGEVRIRNRPPDGEVEPDRLIKVVPARGVVEVPADCAAVYQPSYEVVSSPKLLSQMPLEQAFGVNLADSAANEETVRALAKFKNLAVLILDHSDVNDAGLKFVCRFNELRRLRVESASITPKGLEELPKLKKLIDFSISKNIVGNEGAALIARARNIRRLSVSKCKIGDVGMKSLSTMPNLTQLDLSSNGFITDASASDLARLTKLVKLDITSTGITYLGMRRFQSIMSLRKLMIGANRLTVRQKEQLAGVLNLRCRIIENARRGPDLDLFAPLH